LDLEQTTSVTTGVIDDTLADVVKLPSQIIGATPTKPVKPKPAPKPAVNPVVKAPVTKVDAWSVDKLPGLQGATNAAKTRIGDAAVLPRAGTYRSIVGSGIRAAAGRAGQLAAPMAAPMILALVAVGMLAFAAKGPTRLAKVDEDRQAFHERRSYRL
jgi:hypothetical protein